MTTFATVSLGQVAAAVDYGCTARSSSTCTGPRYVRITDLRDGLIDWPNVPRCDIDRSQAQRYQLSVGDILFARSGATVGKSVLVTDEVSDAVFASYLIRVRCIPSVIDARFASLFFRSEQYWQQINDGASGTGQPNFNGTKLAALQLPLPPLAEQRRIVLRVEALFARTRQARADLLRIAPLARKYRDAATERAFHADEAAGWTVMTAGELAEIKSGVTLGKRHADNSLLVQRPYLRVANVQRGRLKLDEVKVVAVTPADAKRLELLPGDVLMNEGGDLDKLGRGWVWEGQIDGCIHQNHVFRLRLRDDRITPRFLSRYANHFGAAYFLQEGKQTTNLASISMAKVAALPVPVPSSGIAPTIDISLDEAERIAEALRSEASRAIALIDHLERSILTRAFRGELVPQDPSDEPAAVSLGGPQVTASASPRRGRPRRVA